MKKILLTTISAFYVGTFLFAQVPSYVPSSGLIAWWPFTGNANDNSVNLNNGTVYGATLSTDRYGNPNCAYSFNGLTNSITATPSSLPLGSSPRSVSSWINTVAGSIPTSQYPNLQAIIGYGVPLSGPVIFDQMIIAPTGKAYFETGSSQNQIFSTNGLNNGVWHNIVTTYGGPGTRVKIYIDGVINDSTSNVTLATASSVFGIGNTPYANIPFQGKIDDVGIWNRALTASEVCQLNNNPNFNIAASSSTICAGKSTTLTISGASTYTWSNSNIGPSIVVSPTVSTNYTVNGTTSAGCNVVATKSLVILANPTLSVTSGTICSGNSFTILPIGANSYTYSSGSAIISPTSSTTFSVIGMAINGCTNMAISSIIVNPLPAISVNSGSICNGNAFAIIPTGASTYTFSSGTSINSPIVNTSYTVIGASVAGCTNTAISSVTVNTNPTIIVNSGEVCFGSSFTIIPTGANTYTFSSGLSINSPTVSATYTVIGTSVAGCTNTAISSVTVNPNPIITVNSGAICSGSSFTINPIGANTYSYSSGTAINTPSISTSYLVTGISLAGCTNTAVSSVIVNDIPIVFAYTSHSLICLGEVVVLTASSIATTYTWNTGATTISISISPTITSIYTVSVSNVAACVASSTVMVAVDPCTDIKEILIDPIKLYPNPAIEIITVDLTSELSRNLTLEIYNALGTLVMKQILVNELNTISILNLNNGIYTLKILNNSNLIKIGKLIKQ